MRDEIEQYRARGVQPFGINPATADQHAAYAGKLGLPFPLLSDAEMSVARQYQAVYPFRLAVIRTVYLIGTDGKVRFSRRGAPGASISLESLEDDV